MPGTDNNSHYFCLAFKLCFPHQVIDLKLYQVVAKSYELNTPCIKGQTRSTGEQTL